jgi:hypothetical protein
MAEVLGTWAGLDRRVGAIRRKLLDKPEMEPEVLAEVRARLERVLERFVADGRVRLERPRVLERDRSAGGAALGGEDYSHVILRLAASEGVPDRH